MTSFYGCFPTFFSTVKTYCYSSWIQPLFSVKDKTTNIYSHISILHGGECLLFQTFWMKFNITHNVFKVLFFVSLRQNTAQSKILSTTSQTHAKGQTGITGIKTSIKTGIKTGIKTSITGFIASHMLLAWYGHIYGEQDVDYYPIKIKPQDTSGDALMQHFDAMKLRENWSAVNKGGFLQCILRAAGEARL